MDIRVCKWALLKGKLYDYPIIMSIGTAPNLAPNESPLVTERLSDRLAARLAAQIDAGALKPGDRLPTEQQLAAVHGVSRTVVREGVHQLQSRGLLWSRQGSGVFVAAPVIHRPIDYDPTVLDSIGAVVQVVEVRRALEGEMAALAAERATLKQIAGLKRALAAIDAAAVEGRDGVDEDLAFHRAIGEATGNPQFSRLYGFLAPYVREAMRVTKGNEARRRDFMEQVRTEHRAIVEAIAARDPRAARRCMAAHLSHGSRRLEIGGVIAKRGRRK